MGTIGRRMALAALSALAATAVFTAPATAAPYDSAISVQPYAHIGGSGTVTRLTTGAGAPVCDGAARVAEHHRPPGAVHAGEARFEARLQEVRFSGLMPRSVSVLGEDIQDGEIGA